MEFKELGISAPILKALQDEHYEAPTPIQTQAIPAAMSGKDVLGLAQTGTGKTAAFAVPTLQRLNMRPIASGKRKIRSLILTPTRELAIQINDSFKAYGKYLPLRTTVIFGGVGQGNQVRALTAGVDILIATPGRLGDLMTQKYVDLSAVEIFILDEADRMLDMGFIHDVRRIITKLPKQKQTLLFSATMPKEITEIVDHLLVDPVKVAVAPVSSAVDTVEQSVYFVDRNHKVDLLEDLLKRHRDASVLVFTRTKRGADRVVKDLAKRRLAAQAIHGNKSQNARQAALTSFKNKETQVLVATDIAARGIDINELNFVVNYDLPEVPETYVHRIGRTGRAGQYGTAISFCNFQDIPLLKDIEKLIHKEITVIDNPKYPMVDETIPEKKNNGGRQPRPSKQAVTVKKEGARKQETKRPVQFAGQSQARQRRVKPARKPS